MTDRPAAEPVLFDRDGAIVTLTLNRPEDLNAFSEKSMLDAFLSAVDRVKADPEIRCVILTGAGRAFSAGGNVKHMRERTDMFAGGAAEIERAYAEGPHRVPRALWSLDVPVVGAINGPAFGIALDLVCLCDIRIASEKARFGAPFVRIGIGPGDGAAWFLSRIVGPAAAAELILTAEPADAARAKEIGLVSRVVAPEALMTEARTIAAQIAGNAPKALRLSKRLLRAAPGQTLDDHLGQCAAYQGILHGTEDHIEAVTAFLEKRDPVFRDR
jgi:enoyl-CoA hydratase/carnithine racemase